MDRREQRKIAARVAGGISQSAGSMAEATNHSLSHLTAEDLAAIATYVKSVPAVHDASDRCPALNLAQSVTTWSRYGALLCQLMRRHRRDRSFMTAIARSHKQWRRGQPRRS